MIMDSSFIIRAFTTITAIIVIITYITFMPVIMELSNLGLRFGVEVREQKPLTTATSLISIKSTDFIYP